MSDGDFFVDDEGEIRVEPSVITDNAKFGNGELTTAQDKPINTAANLPFVPTGLKSSKIVEATDVQAAIEELDAKTISNQTEIDENEENIEENTLLINQLRTDTDNNTADILTEHNKNIEQDLEIEQNTNKITNLENLITDNANDFAIYSIGDGTIGTTEAQISGLVPITNFEGTGNIEESGTESGVFIVKNNMNLVITNISTLTRSATTTTPVVVSLSVETRMLGETD